MTTKPEPKADVVRVGNLTEDPELRFVRAGNQDRIAVCEARLAYEPYDPETKQRGETGETVFYRLTIWRELGEHAAMSLTKGARVIVTGTPSTKQWTTQAGEPRTDKIITVKAIGPDLRFATATVTKISKEDAAKADALFDEPF